MSFSELSPELLYQILHPLRADGDFLSLKACSLTCGSLVSPSQTYLFHTIRIGPPFPMPAQFLKALQRYSHIQKYVKRVEVSEAGRVWMGSDVALDDMLKILSSSTISLQIVRYLPADSANLLLHDLPALQNLTRLEELEIAQSRNHTPESADRYTIARFCNAFPHLRILDLRQVTSDSSAASHRKPALQSPTFQLEVLKIASHRGRRILKWILPAIFNLKTLCLYHSSRHKNGDHARRAVSCIISGATSLEELHLNMAEQNTKELSYVSTPLRQRDSLRTLVMSALLPLDDAIQVAMAFLQRLKAHLFLEHIVITYTVKSGWYTSGFENFEDVVLGPQFPALKWLELRSEKVEYPEEGLVKMFPRLSEQRKLLLTVQKVK
ncbi:hypothetical protein BDP27DRAFT_1335374 [Rhodocollybia butyracea]|uniref:F-box domain-containing protein n=1 Tax=Rhodocollybia butyracea TaxID=206335 RepID=A0A9P5U279_9AGAR|nr:hypothetical protein BDP27DRAFT_1335374 [Rhodocollybia butyracea]